ncbi:hypothetical protein RHMOL_Rhmol08G0223000 [Rhododendron molle]|nr:hypothetical protein RHMOL_Rhmol08G0223000 [Rhododendron molle]
MKKEMARLKETTHKTTSSASRSGGGRRPTPSHTMEWRSKQTTNPSFKDRMPPLPRTNAQVGPP